jgi:hypothetical protein
MQQEAGLCIGSGGGTLAKNVGASDAERYLSIPATAGQIKDTNCSFQVKRSDLGIINQLSLSLIRQQTLLRTFLAITSSSIS